jgi:hypothetical protein
VSTLHPHAHLRHRAQHAQLLLLFLAQGRSSIPRAARGVCGAGRWPLLPSSWPEWLATALLLLLLLLLVWL